MNDLALYLIKSLLAGAVFFGFYQLVMRRESYFRLNRFYLIATALLIVFLPLLGNLIPLNFFVQNDDSQLPTIILPVIVIKAAGLISPVREQSYLNWGFIGYVIITLVMLIGLVLSIFKIVRFYFAAKRSEKIDGNIYLYPGQTSPFSFLGRIYISRQYLDHPGLNSILIHENAHIRQYHIIDMMLLELLSSLFWFNPFFFLIKKALRETHEFLADRAVIISGAEPINYQKLLYNVVSGNPEYIIANNFNLFTKKRIIMLMKKSDKAAAMRIAVLMPVIMVIVFMVTSLQVKNLMAQSTKQSKQATQKPVKTVTALQPTPQLPPTPPLAPTPASPPPAPAKSQLKSEATPIPDQDIQDKPIFTVVEDMPKFPGGDEARLKYMRESIKYPEEAKKNGIMGTVYVSFIVGPDGSISDVKLLRGIGGGCDEEALRLVKEMPKWQPGKQNGKFVSVQFNMPIQYSLVKDKSKEEVK